MNDFIHCYFDCRSQIGAVKNLIDIFISSVGAITSAASRLIENAMAYVLDNPVKEGKPRQSWSCVTPFTGVERNIVAYP